MLDLARSVARRRWGLRAAFLLACALYLFLGAGMTRTVPPWEAPDETWHAAYAESLATGVLPTLEQTYEAHHPPLYYLWPAAWMRLLSLAPLPHAEQNPYYPFATAVFRHPPGEPLAPPLALLRYLSSLWALPALALVGMAASRLSRAVRREESSIAPASRGWLSPAAVAGLAMLLFGLWPQWLFLSHTLNNDTGAVLAGALLSAGAVRAAVDDAAGRAPPAWLLLGIGAAVAVSAKLNAAALLPALTIGLLVHGWFSPRPGTERGGAIRGLRVGASAHTRAVGRARWTAVAGLLGGAIGAIAALRWGAPSAWSHTSALLGARVAASELATPSLDWPALLGLLAESAWGRLGWMNLRLPVASLVVGVLWMLGGLAGLVVGGKEVRLDGRRAAGLLSLLLAMALTAVLRNMVVDPQPQGRLLFPALPAACVLLALGWSRVLGALRPGAMRNAVLGGLLLCLAFVDVHLVWRGVPAAYATSRTALSSTTIERILPVPWRPVASTTTAGVTWRQTLRASSDELRELSLPVHLSGGRARVRLRVRDAAGRALVEGVETIRGGVEHHWLSLRLPQDPNALRRDDRLSLSIEVLELASGELVLWGGDDVYRPGRFASDEVQAASGSSSDLDLVMVLWHGGVAW